MRLPFTSDQFFGVFAEYNRTFWLVVLVLWLATTAALLATWRNPERSGKTLSYFLSALWSWNAVVYHALLFTRINPAAWFFAALFALQAVLLFRFGGREPTAYFSRGGLMLATGIALVCYALAYPLLSLWLGHGYPATPTFGVPCPTAILMIGLLLTTRYPSWAVSLVPILWGLIGGSAAVLLDVWTDYVLLGAGLILLVVVVIAPRPPRAVEGPVVRTANTSSAPPPC